jgi:hypothetical protein
MALSLLEAAKKMKGEEIRQAIIEIFAMETDLMSVFPFEDIEGNALKYNTEAALPGIAFRGVNESFSESTGIINPQVESLVIAGGDLDVDNFILKTQGEDQRSTQEAMKVKALSHTFSHKIIKGDSTVDPREFDGLQRRITGLQLVANGATSGGDPLSLAKLDEAIDAVDGATHLLMAKALRRRMTAASRSSSLSGFITYEKNDFGKQIAMYAGLPILEADGNGDLFATLGFNEAGSGGGSTATSIYVLSLGEGKVHGIQNGVMDVRDIGELEAKSAKRTRCEWFAGMVVAHPRAASRLSSISNAAVVA